MFELLGGGVIGSVLGGLFRLAPEVMKWLDKKSERDHELAMFDRQCQFEQLKGQQKLAEIGAARDAAVDTGVMSAFNNAIQQQADMVVAAGGWAAKVSALVRPLLTFWVWTLYTVAFGMLLWITWQVTHDPEKLVKLILTPDFMALLCGITNYWFLDRTLARRGL